MCFNMVTQNGWCRSTDANHVAQNVARSYEGRHSFVAMSAASEFPFVNDPLYQALIRAENAYYVSQAPLRHDRFVQFLEALGTFINRGQFRPKMSDIAREFLQRNRGTGRHTRFVAATFELPANGSTKLMFRGQERQYQLWMCLGDWTQAHTHALARGCNLADPEDVARNEVRLDQSGILTLHLGNGRDVASEMEKLKNVAPKGTTFQF